MAASGPDDFTRTQEDPVSFFRLRALHLAPQLGVPLATADEAVAIVVGALGRAWLTEAATRDARSVPIGLGKHPLGLMVSAAGPTQVAECLELAEYLRRLASSASLGEVIAGLKSQYYQALLQLATAARLAIASASRVVLEPPARDGRLSDIAFSYDRRAFRAECYRPTGALQHEARLEMMRVAQDCLEEVRERTLVYSIAIALTENPTVGIRREARKIVRELADLVDASVQGGSQSFPACTITPPWGTVSVMRTLRTPRGAGPRLLRPSEFPEQGDDYDVFLRTGYLTRSEAVGVAVPEPLSEGLSHVAIWLPAETRREASLEDGLDDRLEKLGRKVERKLAQARNDGGAERVLVVDTWITSRLGAIAPDQIERLRRKIVEAHADVAALLLVHRQWMTSLRRHGYAMRPLLPVNRPGLPGELIVRLANIDRLP